MENIEDELPIEMKVCPECKGEKTLPHSNCCGAGMYDDSDLCTSCNEHCIKSDCETCLGSGKIPKEDDDFTDAQDKELDNADEKYDESKLN